MILSFITGFVACVELAFALYKFYLESRNKKYEKTIKQCNILIDDLYSLKESYLKLKGASVDNLFDHSVIKYNKESLFRKEIMRTLTEFEGLAEGMEHKIFDYRLYITLTPKEIIDIYGTLYNFIEKERNESKYTLLFDKSEQFIHNSKKAFNRKLNNQHIPKNYNPKGC